MLTGASGDGYDDTPSANEAGPAGGNTMFSTTDARLRFRIRPIEPAESPTRRWAAALRRCPTRYVAHAFVLTIAAAVALGGLI
jgi:hypothetical protein